ncbi:MAG: type III-B CRISPR module-associated Cmr3 family protein [Candidatus Korarchaeum sp.]
MSAVSMIFRIIEPMMFRGPGEFDPFVRGTYSRAATLAMPSPSTVAGALATYCIAELWRQIPKSEDWIERYMEVLGDDVRVRGPLLKLGGNLMVEDRLLKGFLDMEGVRRKCEVEHGRLVQNPSDELDTPEESLPIVRARGNPRTGIMLEMRTDSPMKAPREGFLYTAEYIDYLGVKRRETSVEIVSEVRGGIAKRLCGGAAPIRFGGENRVSLLFFREGEEILNDIEKRVWGGGGRYEGILALYLATPALFRGGKRVKERVKEWAEEMNWKFLGISGESAVLGAGFDIGRGKRKPIYTSLNPGSIVFLEGSFDLKQIYLDASLGEASSLGYGTLIPVPLNQSR